MSSNFRKSMESTEGRVGSVRKSDQAKRWTFRGRKTGMLPEMPWGTGDDPLGEMTEAAVTGQGWSTLPSVCLTQFQREAVTRECHPGGGDACFQVWGVILICPFVNVSFSQGPELLARSGFTWDLEHIFWGRR